MGLVTPKTEFGFDVIEKGEYKFVVKDTKIDAPKEGAKSGKNYIAVCAVVGGSEHDKNHFERFLENTKDDFSFSKMAGFLIKVGVLKPSGPINTDLFKTPEFEDKWLKAVKGREFGMKIGHRLTGADGKKLENPQSDAKAYYSLDEINAILAKQGQQPMAAATSGAGTPVAAEKSVWD